MAIKETVVLSVESDSSKAEGSVKSLKAQLKEAQAEVTTLADKFGATSEQAVQAAKRAADLKDRIGDAKALTDAFNPDAKFKAFGAALQGVAGGFSAVQGAMGLMGAESEDVQKTLLKVQSAMALSQGLNAIGEAGDAFKTLGKQAVDAFNKIKVAIGTSGIGLLVIALGAIYAYWDDIKEAVSGVSEEQKNLLETQKQSQATAQKSLDAISKQENLLKLQGKSEKEIVQLKMKATAEVIKSLEAQIVTQEEIKKQQIATAQRNQDILKGILDFVTFPLKGLLKTVDMVGKALGKDFGLAEGLTKSVAEMVFDPKKVEEEGNKSIEETKTKLAELKNTQAGYQLDINNQEKEANKKRAEEAKKNADEIKEANKKANEDILKLQQENTLARISDDRKRAEAKLEMDLEAAKKEVENSKASAEIKAKEIQALEEKYMLDLNAMKEKNRLEDEKKAKESADRQLKAEQETFDLVTQARLSQIKDANIKRQEEEAIRFQKETDNLLAQLNNKEITEADFNARREAINILHENKVTENKKLNAEEQKKIEEAKLEHQKQVAQAYSGLLDNLANVVGKQTAVGKGLAIAAATIDTYQAANSALKANYGIFGPAAQIARFASVAATIAMGIKNIKAIASTKVPSGGGGGGGAMPSISATAPVAPQMSSTAINQQLANQQGNVATRAYVVESDVSGSQERINRLNRAARIV